MAESIAIVLLPSLDNWSPHDDETLVQWIETTARRKGVSPLNIDIMDIFVAQISEYPDKGIKYKGVHEPYSKKCADEDDNSELPQSDPKPNSNLNPSHNLKSNTNGTLDPNLHHPTFDSCSPSMTPPVIMQPIKSLAAINTMFATHTDQDIQIRTLLILHMNDLILPLLPLLSGLNSGDSPIGGGKNEPSYLLYNLKHLLFLSVVHEFTYKICRTHDSTYSPTYVIKGSVALANQEDQHAGQIYIYSLLLLCVICLN
jgi:hypothetical protein